MSRNLLQMRNCQFMTNFTTLTAVYLDIWLVTRFDILQQYLFMFVFRFCLHVGHPTPISCGCVSGTRPEVRHQFVDHFSVKSDQMSIGPI